MNQQLEISSLYIITKAQPVVRAMVLMY